MTFVLSKYLPYLTLTQLLKWLPPQANVTIFFTNVCFINLPAENAGLKQPGLLFQAYLIWFNLVLGPCYAGLQLVSHQDSSQNSYKTS